MSSEASRVRFYASAIITWRVYAAPRVWRFPRYAACKDFEDIACGDFHIVSHGKISTIFHRVSGYDFTKSNFRQRNATRLIRFYGSPEGTRGDRPECHDGIRDCSNNETYSTRCSVVCSYLRRGIVDAPDGGEERSWESSGYCRCRVEKSCNCWRRPRRHRMPRACFQGRSRSRWSPVRMAFGALWE